MNMNDFQYSPATPEDYSAHFLNATLNNDNPISMQYIPASDSLGLKYKIILQTIKIMSQEFGSYINPTPTQIVDTVNEVLKTV